MMQIGIETCASQLPANGRLRQLRSTFFRFLTSFNGIGFYVRVTGCNDAFVSSSAHFSRALSLPGPKFEQLQNVQESRFKIDRCKGVECTSQ